jgi:hypothetical protein
MTERDSGPVTPIWSYRVSRYDPALRDAGGAYLPSTWTSWSDIGRSFDGVVLLEPEYLRAEDGYLTSARRFMEESGVESLAMQGVENHSAFSEPGLTIAEGASVAVERDRVRLLSGGSNRRRLSHLTRRRRVLGAGSGSGILPS